MKGVMCEIVSPLDVGGVLRMYSKTKRQRGSAMVENQTKTFSCHIANIF